MTSLAPTQVTSLAGFRFLICLVSFQCLHTFSGTAARSVRDLFAPLASPRGRALLDTSDTRFEHLTPLVTKLKLTIQCPVIFLFVCLLFKLPQQKWYPTGCYQVQISCTAGHMPGMQKHISQGLWFTLLLSFSQPRNSSAEH